MAQSEAIQGISAGVGASATSQTQAPQAQAFLATSPATREQTSPAHDITDSILVSDEVTEESGDHPPTPAIGQSARNTGSANEENSADGENDAKDAKGADGKKDAKDAQAAEEKKKAEEDAKKKEIEDLQKKIDELEKKLEGQKEAGDEPGAKQTQGQLDAARQQLKDLTEPQGAANPVQAVQSAGAPPPAGGSAPVAGANQGDAIPPSMPPSHPYFNPGAPGSPTAPGGAQAPGGPSAPGTSASPGANAKPISPDDLKKGTPMGQALAQEALKHATDGTGDGGHCFRNVGDDLRKFGIQTSGASAYMAADQLAQSDKLKEVSGVSQDDLKKLPPGAVVVWNRGGGHEHGHISIALGDGREASDVLRQQITNYGTSYRVFLPNDG